MKEYIKYVEKDKRQYYDLSIDKITFMNDIDKVKILKDIIVDILNTTEDSSEEEYLIGEIHREVYDYLQSKE